MSTNKSRETATSTQTDQGDVSIHSVSPHSPTTQPSTAGVGASVPAGKPTSQPPPPKK